MMTDRLDTDERSSAASAALAEALRRMIARLALVRPPAEQLERAAQTAAAFADSLDQLPAPHQLWGGERGRPAADQVHGPQPDQRHQQPDRPPLVMTTPGRPDDDDRFRGTVTFGAAYEGPPGHCHGGWIAAVYDELLGYVQRVHAFTAYLKVDYRLPTPLYQPLEMAGWLERSEDRKLYIRGTCHLDGVLLTEAEGLFVRPRDGEDYLARLGQEL